MRRRPSLVLDAVRRQERRRPPRCSRSVDVLRRESLRAPWCCLLAADTLRAGTRRSPRAGPPRARWLPKCTTRGAGAGTRGRRDARAAWRHPRGQPDHVLVVLEDGNPLAVLVGRDARQPLQHLVALDLDAAARREAVRQQRAPDRVRVHDRRRRPRRDDAQVQQRLRRRRADAPSRSRRRRSPTSRMSLAVSSPFCVPLRVIASRSGSSSRTMLKLPLVPSTQPRASKRCPMRDQAGGGFGEGETTRLRARQSRAARPRSPSAAPVPRACASTTGK